MAEPLDLMTVGLSGTHLIEASAGTGKTYTIASLFLRLLLQERVKVESILVVTYTVPATEELKTRIRDRLLQARHAFVAGVSDDDFLEGLLVCVEDRQWAVSTLDIALAGFDQTAISTIHGFCQRMLKELAFETASPFETELVTDQTDMVASAADDFYRMHITSHSEPAFIAFCMGRNVSPEWFVRLAGRKTLSAEVTPKDAAPFSPEDLKSLLEGYYRAFAELAQAWPQAKGEVERLLSDADTINQSTHKVSRIPGYLEGIDNFLAMGPAMMPEYACLSKFTLEAVDKATKKGRKVPVHPLFALFSAMHQAAGALEAALEAGLTALKVEFLSFLDEATRHRKQRRLLVHYDDLLVRMHRALNSKGGDALAAAVGARFKAALIDEFQDTDPLQYEIFTRCFSKSCLFFIGDPKQAIYSFRGADVFTYYRAASSVEGEKTHTLLHNWRSDPALIEAVNAMFSQTHEPFVFEWIRFEDASPAERPDRKVLRGLNDAPLIVWYLDAEHPAGLNVDQANQAVCRACAYEIARLLNLSGDDAVRIGGERIRPSDMAVLVRTNSQARMVRDALRASGIPCVLTSDENVFYTPEAFEMEALLAALAEPHREGYVRAALMTRIFALDAKAIHDLAEDEAAWEGWMGRFRAYHETWERYGFTPMIRALLDAEGVRARLLGHATGERALTNVLHISELLGRAQAAEKLGIQGMRKWLAERRISGGPGMDEYQLRLESDEDALKVMTVHKSKGLEFAVVFCPFAWGPTRQDWPEGVLYHDGEANAVLDLGSKDMEGHRVQAAREALAESVRLLYVALTRARNRCYVAYAKVKNAGNSAMAHLMKNSGDLQQGLGNLVERTSGRAQVKLLPGHGPQPFQCAGEAGPEPSARVFRAAIDRTWGMASYTAFVRGLHEGREAADRDMLAPGAEAFQRQRDLEEAGQAQREPEGENGIFSFPKGARAGTLLHEVFERIDFTSSEAEIRTVVEDVLSAYGLETSWTGAIIGMVSRVLAADLDGMSLAGVKKDQRLTELEFLFPLRPLSPGILEDILRDIMPAVKTHSLSDGTASDEAIKGGTRIPEPGPRFAFEPVKGFLRGFMDLVFVHGHKYYLVDWKSNHLGNAAKDYNPEALLKTMVKDGYVLQYHLYCVALHQYLRNRLEGYEYERHFGGVFYVFLRGVDPAEGKDYGIFRARPDKDVLERLTGDLLDIGQLTQWKTS